MNPQTPTSRATRGSSSVLVYSWGAWSWTACPLPAALISQAGRGWPAPPPAGEGSLSTPDQSRLALWGQEGHNLSREAFGHAATEQTQGSQGRAGPPPQEMPAPHANLSSGQRFGEAAGGGDAGKRRPPAGAKTKPGPEAHANTRTRRPCGPLPGPSPRQPIRQRLPIEF